MQEDSPPLLQHRLQGGHVEAVHQGDGVGNAQVENVLVADVVHLLAKTRI